VPASATLKHHIMKENTKIKMMKMETNKDWRRKRRLRRERRNMIFCDVQNFIG
jgi:ATP-dependent protease HslVU (ClpYQ) peptidase subunit